MTGEHWPDLLDAAIRTHGVPGASLALWLGGRETIATAGVTDVGTGGPVTPATVFRLGSATKILTAMLVMQQVEAGAIALDAPVRRALPDFTLADPDAAALVTPRHCLSHLGGFFGDILDGPSEGDDALTAYVAAGGRLVQVTPPGLAFSYCNAGFAIAGRLSEAVGGQVWDRQVGAALLAPMGMARTGFDPAALPPDAARPHLPGPDGAPAPAPHATTGRAMAPAGSLAWTTPSDMVRLGRTLIAGGVAPGGARLLSGESVAAMRALAVDGPTPTFATGWGLGIQRFTRDGATFGHDGAVLGQNSFLRLNPVRDLVVALTCNGGDARGLFAAVIDAVERDVGARLVDPTPAWPDPAPVDRPARYVGRYAVPRYTVEVQAAPTGLLAQFIPSAEAGDFGAPLAVELRAQPDDPTGELFLARMPGNRLPVQQRFGRLPDGRRSLLFRGRLLPEVTS